VRLSGGMPRTLYSNNHVSPDVHRIRALGRLVFNALGCMLSSVTYLVAPHRSVTRELAATSAAGHALLFVSSLMPLPIVDGGTLMKWTLVAHGRTQARADEIVRRVDWAMALACAISGVSLIATRRLAAGAALMGSGVVVAAVAAGRLR
jgi:hypothetical protein